MSKAIEACKFILNRAVNDRQFSFHIVGTRSMSHLCEAIAEHEGKHSDEVLVQFNLDCKLEDARREEDFQSIDPLEVTLQKQVDEAREKIRELKQKVAHLKARRGSRAISADMEEYLRLVENGLYELKLETLREILAGVELNAIAGA